MDKHLFAIGLVLGEVFHVDVAEVSKAGVQGDESTVNASDFHTLEQFATEVEPSRGGGDGSFVAGKECLETLHILFFHGAVYNLLRQGSFTQGVKGTLELVVWPVVEEAQGTSA